MGRLHCPPDTWGVERNVKGRKKRATGGLTVTEGPEVGIVNAYNLERRDGYPINRRRGAKSKSTITPEQNRRGGEMGGDARARTNREELW